MDIAIYNDTTTYHNGCLQVMTYLLNDLASHTILERHETITGKGNEFNINPKVDLIIINGEGTLHHSRTRTNNIFHLIKAAHKAGKEIALINCVFQENELGKELIEILKQCYITVRDILSYNELLKHGIKSEIYLDLSYFVDVPIEQKEYNHIYCGQFFYTPEKQFNAKRIDIFNQKWIDIVNCLRQSDLLISGRHHEIYAACKARCNFLAVKSNSWKIEGLIETAKCNIPVFDYTDIEGIDLFILQYKKYEKEFEKLFNYMESQKQFTFEGKI